VILIHRPATPEILTKQGKQRNKTHCKNYEKEEAAYCAGTKTFAFDQKIYAHDTVKSALIAMQHSKCCYCERRIGEAGDVEHFRPKGSVCQDEYTAELVPGYYWLAYEWDNLLYACKECNQRHKGVLFPLADPTKRVRSHKSADRVVDEASLLIDPSRTDPEPLIGFREEFAFARSGDAVAETSIRVYGLNHPDLRDARRRRLNDLRLLSDLVLLAMRGELEPADKVLVGRAKKELDEATTEFAEFSAMVRESLFADSPS
jgi:uncharacterized protein (TIGR02646 family)